VTVVGCGLKIKALPMNVVFCCLTVEIQKKDQNSAVSNYSRFGCTARKEDELARFKRMRVLLETLAVGNPE
jgi:hypothetical protein